jgi:hypothetical protein
MTGSTKKTQVGAVYAARFEDPGRAVEMGGSIDSRETFREMV